MPALYLKTDWPIPHPFQIIEEFDLVASWEFEVYVPDKYLNLIFGLITNLRDLPFYVLTYDEGALDITDELFEYVSMLRGLISVFFF